MSQTFNLCIATETLANDAQRLGVSTDTLRDIQVVVHATIVQQPSLQLQLTYQIVLPTQSLADRLYWPTWKEAHVGFTDYLWEESCLECFIAGNTLNQDGIDSVDDDSKTAYIEINASPDGRYALYRFESYRNPATLPPFPLLVANKHTRAKINWIDPANSQIPSVEVKPSHKSSTAHTLYSDKRTFSVPIHKIFSQKFALSNLFIEHIHPCVILWFGETALYFASSHASPPDFHNRRYWSRFNPKAAYLNSARNR
ncbi:RES domain-containing protein [Psychrobacter okhotskensis]|uniref:hypothetical protein n=1 Tax=Psychrobacter okhotskensis TaxID=212403 RepID=UPI003F5595E3